MAEGRGDVDVADRPALQGRLGRVEMVINPAAGRAGPQAGGRAEALFAEFGVSARVTALEPGGFESMLREVIGRDPDLLVVLAGDGTARAAASLCGPDGPLLAPLPGGTMNMLPHALYGQAGWVDALRSVLTEGVETEVSGGSVDGKHFYVAAILGAPALWAQAREAARSGELAQAIAGARRAMSRAFSSRLHYSLDGGPSGRAEALTLMCPRVSRAMPDDAKALEADVLNPSGAAEAFRLGFRALLSEIAGDWRLDPSVEVARCRTGLAWARTHIPAILDGEPMRLGRRVEIAFLPVAFRALAPPRTPVAK